MVVMRFMVGPCGVEKSCHRINRFVMNPFLWLVLGYGRKKNELFFKNTTVKSRALLSFVSAQRVQTGYVIGASCVQFHFC